MKRRIEEREKGERLREGKEGGWERGDGGKGDEKNFGCQHKRVLLYSGGVGLGGCVAWRGGRDKRKIQEFETTTNTSNGVSSFEIMFSFNLCFWFLFGLCICLYDLKYRS